jgi:E3 ubiquitin-protein ligase HECTD1
VCVFVCLCVCANQVIRIMTSQPSSYRHCIDMSVDCARRIVAVEGALAAMCTRLKVADLSIQELRDLSIQTIKVLELISSREPVAVFEAGALDAAFGFITNGGGLVYVDDTTHRLRLRFESLCSQSIR